MITRTVRAQLLLFVAFSLVGVTLAGARYAGVGESLFGDRYLVRAHFAESGGIFVGAEVTYRGVAVGQVEELVPTTSGVDVVLALVGGTQVPADTVAVVENRSAIGEQYVDLQPRSSGEPYLRDGSEIPRSHTRTPLSTAKLLLDLDRLVNSVPRDDLVTVIDELGTAFEGSGDDLTRLIEAGNALIEAADTNLDETVRLIEDGRTVLETQRESGDAIRSFSRDLARLSDTLVASDADLRQTLDSGVVTARQLNALIDENAGDVPILLGNLVTTGQIVRARLAGVKHILILYPYVVRGGYTVVTQDARDGGYTAHFGLQLALIPGACRQGYEGTEKRPPEKVEPTPANTGVRCTDASTNQRGAQWAPPPDEEDGGSGGVTVEPAAYDPSSGRVQLPNGQTARIGSLGGQHRAFGEDSWKWLLIGPVTG
ncbi:MAG TPA: MlaD family protein [Actinopolymorphaceae bacterium]